MEEENKSEVFEIPITKIGDKKSELSAVCSVGDIAVCSSSENIEACGEMVIKLIKNKHISSYLNGSWTKKKFSAGNMIG
jgi:hypothetical protein